MPGQIPKYGENFRLESLPWTPGLANRVYVLKRDPAWCIQSDKPSKAWTIFYRNPSGPGAIAISPPLPTLTLAMTRLLDGIAQGFYQAQPEQHSTNHEQETRS